MNTVTSDFYVTGGTLRRDAPSYVKRRADEDLYNGLSTGHFCYVLTSRQMGKSSLMVRTAVRLRADGVSVAVLDLTAVGHNVTPEQWYEGLLNLIGQQLDLEDELEEFWLANRRVGILQRWMRAIREVIITRNAGRVIIFVDEIDAVRSLQFSTDEFFSGIRELYNWRTEDEELSRLTFCLLGVATPSDLIRDTRTTPFNIGQRIELTDFSEEEAALLIQGLGRDEKLSRLLLQRILYWTGGHPYLTQRLCQGVAANDNVRSSKGVDRLCEEIFLSPRASERDDNLLFVRERMLRSEEADRASLLDLYQQVCRNKRVPDDETNALISVLRLSGVTRAVKGYLYVRNRIYRRVFDQKWVTAHMPDAELQRQRAAYRKGVLRAAAIAALILVVTGSLAVVAIQQRNRAERNAQELQTALAEARRQKEIAQDKSRQADERQRQAEQNQQLALEAKDQAEKAENRASEDAARARRAEKAAAANAERAEAALRAAQEQRQIAERNVQIARAAQADAEVQKQIAVRNEQGAKESERRLHKQRLDDNDTIYSLASRLEEISPVTERPYWSFIKGSARTQMGNHEEAIKEFTKTIAAHPDHVSALMNRSYSYLIVGQPERTVNDAQNALRLNPYSPVANVNISLGLSMLGRYQEAESIIREKSIPTFVHTGYGEYPQHYISPDIQKATGRKVINADGDTALTALHYELANIRAIAGDDRFEAALTAADQRPPSVNAYLFALNWAWLNYQQRPQDYGALAAQGAMWERADFKERALQMYQAFQDRHKAQPDTGRYVSLARWVESRINALQNGASRVPVNQHQTEQPDARDLNLEAVESLYKWGPDTLKLMTRAIELDERNVDYLLRRARFLYNANDYVGARNDFNAVLTRAPRTASAYLYRALANASDELNASPETILGDILEAKKFDPTVVPSVDDPLLVKVTAILSRTNFDAALDLLERTATNNSPSPMPYLQLASMLNERRAHKEALEKINAALALQPDMMQIYDERRKAEEGLCQKKDVKDSTCLNQPAIMRRQATAYREVGDTLLKQGKAGEALDAYARSLRLLNDLAGSKDLPEIKCDISATLQTVAQVVEGQGSRAKAAEYLEVEFGDLNNLKESLNNEIRRLSNSL